MRWWYIHTQDTMYPMCTVSAVINGTTMTTGASAVSKRQTFLVKSASEMAIFSFIFTRAYAAKLYE